LDTHPVIIKLKIKYYILIFISMEMVPLKNVSTMNKNRHEIIVERHCERGEYFLTLIFLTLKLFNTNF